MKKTLRNFLFLIQEEKKGFILLILLLILFSFIELLSLALLVPLILVFQDIEKLQKIVTENLNIELNLQGFSEQEVFLYFLIIIIFVFIAKFFLLTYIQIFKYNFLKKLNLIKSSQFFQNILNKDPIFFSKNSIAYLMQVAEENRIFFSNTLNNIFMIFQDISIGILIILVLLKVETTGTLFVIFFVFFCSYLIYLLTKKKLTILGEKKFNFSKEVIGTLKEGFEGIREIKIFKAEKFFSERLRLSNSQFLKVSYDSEILKFLPKPLFEVLVTIFLILIFKYISSYTINFDFFLIKLSVYVLACIRLVPIAYRLVVNFQTLKFSFFSFERIVENLTKDEKDLNDNKKNIINFEKSITFNKVFFKYEDDYVLKNLSLDIKKGDSIAIIGPSGSGKSTFIDLLIGFLKPSNGDIKIDNKSVSLKSASWHENISYVPQRISLNNTTIRKNVAFGVTEKEIVDQKVYESIKFANLDRYVSNLKKGIDSDISDFGINISGGQAQRIGIARAIYKDCELMIFDESTSSLDEKNENEILETISKLKQKKTLIFVTHKKNILKYFNKVFFLEDGNLVEKKN